MLSTVLQKIIIAATLTMSAQVAQAVTVGELAQEKEGIDSVTTSAAVRANADVQIRRIKNLMVLTKSGEDQAMIKIQRLQKELRGEK